MNRTHRSLTRIFKHSKSAIDNVDDLPAVEKSFRSSSFALLPSAVTPSRVPSNTFIASFTAALFETPVRFHIPYGRERWPDVVDWYNNRGSKDSAAIYKIQLRKDYQHPYYHEYIVIFTRGHHTYRVDRRPDADAAFNTIMKEGCTAYDTIEEVDSTSWKHLDATSDCVVELHWQGEQTFDLLSVLAICFRIHNDKCSKRYTLQHYNCYFVSWTIILIIVRTITACAAKSNVALERGVGSVVQVLEARWALETERALQVEQDRALEADWERRRQWGRERERQWEQQLAREWAPEVKGVQGWRQDLDKDPNRAQEQARERGLQMEREVGLWRELDQQREQELNQQRKRAQVLAPVLVQMLAQMPLVLGWQLVQGWKYERANVREKLRELLQDADTLFLPGELDLLAKTNPDRQATVWVTFLSCLT
jgi:hypothetical protein